MFRNFAARAGIVIRNGFIPSFYRDFIKFKSLNNHGIGPNITFTRATNATYFDSNGILRFAPHNVLRNSQAAGATDGVVGSNGSLPTHWTNFNAFGNQEVVRSGTDAGFSYVDVRFYGTNSTGDASFLLLGFDEFAEIPATSGQTWTSSFYVKLQSGSIDGIALNANIRGRQTDTTGTEITTISFLPTSLFQRKSATINLNNANTTRVSSDIVVVVPNNQSIDFTLRIAAPQLERNNSASEYIPTTGTAKYDQPRFDHDPVTGVSKGLLIEESRTNLFQRSAEFNNDAYWQKLNATVTANATTTTAPDGTTTADAVFETVHNDVHLFRALGILTVDTTNAVSVFAKANGRTTFMIQIGGVQSVDFDLSAKTATPADGGAGAFGSIEEIGNGWFRCVAVRSSTANGNVSFVLKNGTYIYAGDVNKGMYFWGAQAEQASFATSYIPTTGGTAIRAADSAFVTPISSFYNQSEGTVVADVSILSGALGINNTIYTLRNDANNYLWNWVWLGTPNLPRITVFNSGLSQADLTSSTVLAGTAFKTATRYKANDFAFVVDAGTVGINNSGSLPPAAVALDLGKFGDFFFLNGHIRKIAYWPKRLSNTLLQEITT